MRRLDAPEITTAEGEARTVAAQEVAGGVVPPLFEPSQDGSRAPGRQ